MAETFLDGRVVLHAGDCLERLAEMEPDSVDAVVTDPPYHLTSIVKRFGADGAANAKSNGATGIYQRAAAGFMGQTWDGGDIAFRPETWAAVARVLKPGGHLVAFGAAKNTGLLQHAIEAGGFETRDTILNLFDLDPRAAAFLSTLDEAQVREMYALMDHATFGGLLAWVFGSGFPKSHNVAKAIDKSRKEDVEPIRTVCRFVRAGMDRLGLKSRDLTQHFGDCNPRLIDHWAARDTDSQPSLPTPSQWDVLKAVLSLSADMDAEVDRLNACKGEPGDAWRSADIVGIYDGVPGGFGDHRFGARDAKIRAASEAAEDWEGWGTALKPAFEPIILARKPLVGTIADTVLAHGTGALNINGCRVAGPKPDTTRGAGGQNGAYSPLGAQGRIIDDGLGRWPANVIHDGSDMVVETFPANAGAFAPVRGTEGSLPAKGDAVYGARDRVSHHHHGDAGSAARFFYSAKADGDARIGSNHPTVKPIDLMRWLVRLVTPPGGVVLDLFAGTGTTGEAAWREGFRAVLIEREAKYREDIARRMKLCLEGPAIRRAESARAKGKAPKPMALFGEDVT